MDKDKTIPKAGSQAWYEHYKEKTLGLGDALELPRVVSEQAAILWRCALAAPRSPTALLVDCLYICAKLSGNRISIKGMKRMTKEMWGKSVGVLHLDRRSRDRRWIWDYQDLIKEIYPDEAAWDDFVGAWQGNVVDSTYFDEE